MINKKIYICLFVAINVLSQTNCSFDVFVFDFPKHNIKKPGGLATRLLCDANYNVEITGGLTVDCDFTVNGNATIGTDSSNTLTINAATTFVGPVVIPTTDFNGMLKFNNDGPLGDPTSTPDLNSISIGNDDNGGFISLQTNGNDGRSGNHTISLSTTPDPAIGSATTNATGSGAAISISTSGGRGTVNNAGTINIFAQGAATNANGGAGGAVTIVTTGGAATGLGSPGANGFINLSTGTALAPTGAIAGTIILNTASSAVASPVAGAIVLNAPTAAGLYINNLTTPSSVNIAALLINTSTGQVFNSGSSEILKINIKYLHDVRGSSEEIKEASEIYQLQPCTFRYKTNLDESAHEFGLIAEDLDRNNVMKSAVCYNAEGQPVNINYQSVFIALLHEFIQLKKQFDVVAKEHEALKPFILAIQALDENQATRLNQFLQHDNAVDALIALLEDIAQLP